MTVDVVLLPEHARPDSFQGMAVAVFDVLRATTTMTAALASGVKEIRLFGSIEAARDEAREAGMAPRPMLCGEQNCLRPEGFDLGNSPCEMVRPWGVGQGLLMCTTNGTRAIIAARGAREMFVGGLVNASAVARALTESRLDVTLLCAGTNGRVAMEDVLGAGAVVAGLGDVTVGSDSARIARELFNAGKHRLPELLRATAGGRNVLAAGLERDIDFAATLDKYDVVGKVDGERLRVAL